MSRQRCAQSGCRHAPRAHQEGDGCSLCSCGGWLDRKPHTWRSDVTEAWLLATHAWLLDREEIAIGYPTEMREFEANHPRPRLADFMDAMSFGTPPEQLLDLFTPRTVCTSCHGTGRTDGHGSGLRAS